MNIRTVLAVRHLAFEDLGLVAALLRAQGCQRIEAGVNDTAGIDLEADPRRIEPWLVGHAAELSRASVDIPALRADAARHGAVLAAAPQRVVGTWLERP